MDNRQNTSTHAVTLSPRRGVVTGLVYLFEQVMPDPFVLSICLTLVVILLAVGTQCIVPGDPHRLVHRDVQYPGLRAADDPDSRDRIRDCGRAAYPERTACDGGRCPDTDKGRAHRFSYCGNRFMVELGPGAGRRRVACTRDRQARESRFRMARGRQLLSVVRLQ